MVYENDNENAYENIYEMQENTSLAALGALAHYLQYLTLKYQDISQIGFLV